MKPLRWVLFSTSLVLTGLLVCGGATAADSAAGQRASEPQVAGLANTALASHSPEVLLLDRGPAAGQNKLQPDSAPRRQPDELRPLPLTEMRVALEVLVEGKPLRTIPHEGKTYLPVPRPGAEYEIRVWNHGSHRVVALVSVDGLSVITGQPASAAQPGYVVAPHSSILIKGWRRSLETVAAFRFVEREKSYAALMGHPENVGVIGLLAIEEQVWRPRPGLEQRDTAGAAAKRATAEVGSIGTEYGREVDSRVYFVPFARSANRRTITFYYDTAKALREAGVPVDRPHPVPFPGDPPFAPPPPGYKGGKSK